MIKAVTCFLGAHYLSFVRSSNSQHNIGTQWRMYNDDETDVINDWAGVLTKMLDMKI